MLDAVRTRGGLDVDTGSARGHGLDVDTWDGRRAGWIEKSNNQPPWGVVAAARGGRRRLSGKFDDEGRATVFDALTLGTKGATEEEQPIEANRRAGDSKVGIIATHDDQSQIAGGETRETSKSDTNAAGGPLTLPLFLH